MKIEHQTPHTYAINPQHYDLFTPQWFEVNWWQAQQAVIGFSQGRGITWFVRCKTYDLVLRHYYRGGLLGKILNDWYCFTGFKQSRAVQEYRLLQTMQALDLPVPTPWAVRLTRYGLCYKTDILLQRLENTQDLVHILQQQPLSAAQWYNIGATIQRFHQAGIYHADLNSHNILLDKADKVWLIDFDKGLQRSDHTWKAANLQRLYRSLRKEKGLQRTFHWQINDWSLLLAGYNGSTSAKA